MKGNYHQYYVCILSNIKNGTFYIGVANDLERRIYIEYGLNKLMYFESYQYVNDAIKREKQLKNWNRQWKIDLIEEENINWVDLSKDWN